MTTRYNINIVVVAEANLKERKSVAFHRMLSHAHAQYIKKERGYRLRGREKK